MRKNSNTTSGDQFLLLFGGILATTLTLGCGVQLSSSNSDVGTSNWVRASAVGSTDRTIGDKQAKFRVVSGARLSLSGGLTPNHEQADPSGSPLMLGFPVGLLGEQNLFGGVIIAVSDKTDEDLGGLKLSDLSPVHVRTQLSSDRKTLDLVGCKKLCTEESVLEVLFSIPVSSEDAQYTYLDLTRFGSGLDILESLHDTSTRGALTQTKVTQFDYSMKTLVFDVENTYRKTKEAGEKNEFTLTTRWYLKLASGFSPNFTSRVPTEGVGFFPTARGASDLITRFALNPGQKAVAKYYIKNVPERYKRGFVDSFEGWNKKLSPILGQDLFEYEFLSDKDPRFALIVPGDIRYNVLEWDLVNKAGYGGLGPSIASQTTGQTFSANVLIQGPGVEKIYKDWFRIQEEAQILTLLGQPAQAEAKKMAFVAELQAQENSRLERSRSLSLEFQNMKFHQPSRDPRLADKGLNAMDFLDVPPGYTYDTYMYGYLIDMVAHELGHNLGLRHNFKGNLGALDNGQIGSVSRSIMEYLGRPFRHLDRIGAYDVMAISYGYKGVAPEHKDWYCTDEDQVSPDAEGVKNSAECSSDDATSDPFAYDLSVLHRLKEFLLLPGTELASEWTSSVLEALIKRTGAQLMNYVVSAETTAKSWTQFRRDSRDVPVEETKKYVLGVLKDEICDPALDIAVGRKFPEAQAATQANLDGLRKVFGAVVKEYSFAENFLTSENFPCLDLTADPKK